MKIEVFGTGCAKCKTTKAVVKEVVEKMGLQADIVEVNDINDIIARGVLMTPAVAIDGQVKVSGRVPTHSEIEQIISG